MENKEGEETGSMTFTGKGSEQHVPGLWEEASAIFHKFRYEQESGKGIEMILKFVDEQRLKAKQEQWEVDTSMVPSVDEFMGSEVVYYHNAMIEALNAVEPKE